MEDLLSQAPPAKGDIDKVDGKHEIIEKRFRDLLEPLSKKRKELETAKSGYQLDRDLADELVSNSVVCVFRQQSLEFLHNHNILLHI